MINKKIMAKQNPQIAIAMITVKIKKRKIIAATNKRYTPNPDAIKVIIPSMSKVIMRKIIITINTINNTDNNIEKKHNKVNITINGKVIKAITSNRNNSPIVIGGEERKKVLRHA